MSIYHKKGLFQFVIKIFGIDRTLDIIKCTLEYQLLYYTECITSQAQYSVSNSGLWQSHEKNMQK